MIAKDLRERILRECGIDDLSAKVDGLVKKADALEARLTAAEERLAGFGATIEPIAEDADHERRIAALEASLGVYEAEAEVREPRGGMEDIR